MANYVPKLPSECYEMAKLKLGETETVRQQCINEIFQWVYENPSINANTNLQVILYFLRATKFRIDKTKNKIKKFYRLRALRPEWYGNRNPFEQHVVELLELGIFLPLKYRDSENRLVIVIRIAAHDPAKHLQDNVIKVGKMVLDLALHLDESISVYGLIAIFDMKNVTLSHALQMHPALIQRLVESWECYPCLVKKLEFINAPIYVNCVLNTFRFFMSAKLKSRIFVRHGKSQIDCKLPVEIGGTSDSYEILANYWRQQVEANAQWYNDTDKFKSII